MTTMGVRSVIICIVLACLLSLTAGNHHKWEAGGGKCLACTIGLGLLNHVAQVQNDTVFGAMQYLCRQLADHPDYQLACNKTVTVVSKLFYHSLQNCTPDTFCASINMCPKSDSGQPACHLFPLRHDVCNRAEIEDFVDNYYSKFNNIFDFCDLLGIRSFCDMIDNVIHNHKPFLDLDNDGFVATFEALRGSYWRGCDCNDLESQVHPGRRPLDDDRYIDSNCNGIFGYDEDFGIPYELSLCDGSKPRGVMLIGDSAGAHFRIPPQFLYAPDLTREVLRHLPTVVANELDFPMLSAATGFMNLSWPIVDNYTNSLYLKLRDRNRCNHRDYHNLGVNGYDSGDILKHLENIKRNQTTDYPLLVVYEAVGNDVCNRYSDTVPHMTTPETMRKNILATLQRLDELLPANSHVLLIGLADGRFLWDSLHNRYHPLGMLNKDVRYPVFYDFLTCSGNNPCNGWMTQNETLREFTSQRAWELSQELKRAARESTNKYHNFDVHFIDCPLTAIIEQWEIEFGPLSGFQLIEPVDGFHPNQMANIIFADYVWNYLSQQLPHYLGDVNPFNDKIVEIFHNQGGHLNSGHHRDREDI